MNTSWRIPPSEEDALLQSSRREMRVSLIFWAVFAAWTIGCAMLFAYDKPREGEEIALVLGMPAWVFWGIMLPWALATTFTIVFSLRSMADHDLLADEPEDHHP